MKEPCHLKSFIDTTVQREFKFNAELLNKLYLFSSIEKCPHVNVKFTGSINLPRFEKKRTRNIHLHLRLEPSGKEESIIYLDGDHEDTKTVNFFTENNYQNPMDMQDLGFELGKSNGCENETLELTVSSINKYEPYDTNKWEKIGNASVPLNDSMWYDRKYQEWPLFNEFGNRIGEIFLMMSFRNQDLPSPSKQISTLILNQIAQDLNVIVPSVKTNKINKRNIKVLTESKQINAQCQQENDFYLDISYNQEVLLENHLNNIGAPDTDLYVVHMLVNDNLIADFNLKSHSTQCRIKNSFIDDYEVRIYKLIQRKQLRKKTAPTLAPKPLNAKRLSIQDISSSFQLFGSTESFTSLTSSGSTLSSNITLDPRVSMESKTLSIQRSYGKVSSNGAIKNKTKELLYKIVFQRAFKVCDIPWLKGGLSIAFHDKGECTSFKFHIEILHSSQVLEGKNVPILSKKTTRFLLKNIFQSDFQRMTNEELSNWNGDVSKNGQNLLAILSPNFRRIEWDEMIGWELMKLFPMFSSLNTQPVYSIIRYLDFKHLDEEKLSLVQAVRSTCINRLAHFDTTNSLNKSFSSHVYLKGLIMILKRFFDPEKVTEWKDEIRSNIKTAIEETSQLTQISPCSGNLSILHNINDNLLKGYTIPNLEFIEKEMDFDFSINIWRPVLACATLKVLFPMLETEFNRFQGKQTSGCSCDGVLCDGNNFCESWSKLTLKVHKNLTIIARIARIRKHGWQFDEYNQIFAPCYPVWVQTCAAKAMERVNRVVQMEAEKDLTFNSYKPIDDTVSAESTQELDVMQGSVDVKTIFASAKKVWEGIDWLDHVNQQEFGRDLYNKLYEVFLKYIEKLQELVLKDDEFWPHELNYVLKSMFDSVVFLDDCFGKLKTQCQIKNHCMVKYEKENVNLNQNCFLDNCDPPLLGGEMCRDTLINAFCKWQRKHFQHFLTQNETINKENKMYLFICGEDRTFHGYMYGLVRYFENNLLKCVENHNISPQLKECFEMLKANILTVGIEELQKYHYSPEVKSNRDSTHLQIMHREIEKTKILKLEYEISGHECVIEDIETDIKLKVSTTCNLISQYLGAYKDMIDEMKNLKIQNDSIPLICVGNICFNIGIKDNRLYVSLKNVSNLKPMTGYNKCNFQIQILLSPPWEKRNRQVDMANEGILTPIIENRTHYMFDISSPAARSSSPRTPLFRKFSFSGKINGATKPDSFTVDFDIGPLGRTNDKPTKFLEFRLFDHTGYGNIFRHYSGSLIYPINVERVSNIDLLDDFLYGCNGKFRVNGEFTKYLEDCNRANPRLKTLYNELEFRYKDPIARSFIKSQKRLLANYLAKK